MEVELPTVTSPPPSQSFERMAKELAVVFSTAPLAPYLPRCRSPMLRNAISQARSNPHLLFYLHMVHRLARGTRRFEPLLLIDASSEMDASSPTSSQISESLLNSFLLLTENYKLECYGCFQALY
ncbi:hypothetical protein Cni_G01062 [Canna indica]|uniref:Uncharacterized protein n=1 Tax=Canna indica TaxID=4628 RepID=A0AAQ3JMF1_9LILI|nr:hypothetical protein Cni_G01062 [Canna indica]